MMDNYNDRPFPLLEAALLAEINGALRAHRRIHENVFGTFRIRAVFPLPIIFGDASFGAYAMELNELEGKLQSSRELCSRVSNDDDRKLTSDETAVLATLQSFVDELTDAVRTLRRICWLLQVRTEGRADYSTCTKMELKGGIDTSWSHYRNLVIKYRKIINSCRSTRNELNTMVNGSFEEILAFFRGLPPLIR